MSQLAAMAKEKKANIVFAVMGDVYDVHNRLASFIEGSAVDMLDENSANIIKLVRDNYDVRPLTLGTLIVVLYICFLFLYCVLLGICLLFFVFCFVSFLFVCVFVGFIKMFKNPQLICCSC